MEKFKILDISGDIGLKAYGKSKREVFVNTAIGMYSLITNLDSIKEKKTINVSVESHSPDGLLVSWLNELIFQFDAYDFIGKKIEIKKFSDNKITTIVTGEDFDLKRHERKLLIKAATYHGLRIEKIDDVWEANVIFDI
jgi:SHS2 domain-containing protein